MAGKKTKPKPKPKPKGAETPYCTCPHCRGIMINGPHRMPEPGR